MATTVAYRINVPLDVARRASRDNVIARIRSAFANARWNLLCVDYESRTVQVLGIGPSRASMVATVAVDRELTATDYVRLDAIVFGAFKAATNSGWSTAEMHSRLNPTGSSSDSLNLVSTFGEVSGVERIVTDGASCALSTVRPGTLQRSTVIDGAPGTVGVQRNPPPLVPPNALDGIPLGYKIAAGVVGVSVVAIGVAYVARSFK